ncbi:hypothetical protein ACFP3I_14365 [Chryseobacterium arachidis]
MHYKAFFIWSNRIFTDKIAGILLNVPNTIEAIFVSTKRNIIHIFINIQ